MFGENKEKNKKPNKFNGPFRSKNSSRKPFGKFRPQRFENKPFPSQSTKPLESLGKKIETKHLQEMKKRIHDTFLEGIDDQKQMGVEEKIVEFLENIAGHKVEFFQLSKNLTDRSIIKTSEDLKRALTRLVDIGVVENNGDIVRLM
ncbi:MAG: hypothetical protein Q7S92_04820 [Candidatus Diapherotrites archaeon]|nr:hypothetical protein [Candidatus Diapherotrites archaeon]